MFNMIKRFMDNLTKEQVNNFALKNAIILSTSELDFTYIFVKKNWETILGNPSLLNLSRYENHYSKDNFIKIEHLFKDCQRKYQRFL